MPSSDDDHVETKGAARVGRSVLDFAGWRGVIDQIFQTCHGESALTTIPSGLSTVLQMVKLGRVKVHLC
jgi:hypothetical protein